jgi:tetratricopeptide (TPR) repeat protein
MPVPDFMDHLYWHKPRLVMLGPKIEALPDDHPSKAQCLKDLSWLFYSVGNWVERKRLLTHTLKLWRERGDDYQVALTLSTYRCKSAMGLYEEGIQQAREASEIFERLGNTWNKQVFDDLARVLYDDKQLDAAEEAASRAIDLLPEKGEQLLVCQGHRTLGDIYHAPRAIQRRLSTISR